MARLQGGSSNPAGSSPSSSPNSKATAKQETSDGAASSKSPDQAKQQPSTSDQMSQPSTPVKAQDQEMREQVTPVKMATDRTKTPPSKTIFLFC